MTNPPRIDPAETPYDDAVQKQFDRLMPPDTDPLILFRTLARDSRLFSRFMSAGLLDKGHLSMREREIAIDRTCAVTGNAYEWGVHITFFKEAVSLSDEEVEALALSGPENPVWTPREGVIIELMDSLHETSTIAANLWVRLQAEFEEMAIMELIMLAGFYHTVAYLSNGLDLPLEAYGAPLPRR